MNRYQSAAAIVIAALILGAFIELGDSSSGAASQVIAPVQSAMPPTSPASIESPSSGVPLASPTEAAVPASATDVADLSGDEPTNDTPCVLEASTLRAGDTGADVSCLQRALVAAGLLPAATGEFDVPTADAVRTLQTQRNLFVDGVVGRETGIALEIWPDESARVVRTPAPPHGAVDLLGYPLSSVASSGTDAPPLPPDSGTGRRLVYDRAGQRIWAVDKDGRILRSWLVSGSKYNNETPGTHEVYSRSEMSTAWNGKAFLPKMVRWLKTDIGAIGFHGLPRHVEDNSKYQTDAELGTRLSGGCQRQADLDAAFTWDFAQIGTRVVVL